MKIKIELKKIIIRKRCVAQQRIYLTKKEESFFKPFAEQADSFRVLNFPTSHVENLGP